MDVASEKRHWGKTDSSVLLAWHEARLSGLISLAGLGTAILTSSSLAFVILTQASQPWHYLADAVLMGLVLLFCIPVAAYIRRAQSSVFRQVQAALSSRLLELQDIAARDELTQLFNRRYFYQRLQEGLERARQAREPLALMLIDVDNLKGLNDDYGHLVGDTVLRNLAQVIKRQVRASDVAARLGGDEFGVAMLGTDKRGAFALARRLWQELAEHPLYEKDGLSLHLDISIGVSGYPWGGDDVDQMMRWADADMYANKVSRKLAPSLTEEEMATDIEAVTSDYV